MKNLTAIFIVFLILPLIAISCGNERGPNKSMEVKSLGPTDKTAVCQQAKILSQDKKAEEFKSRDFFGVKMQGKYEDIVDKIYALPVLSLVDRRDTIMLQGNGDKRFSHTVEFCGVPWGMSANFTLSEDNIMSIHDLKFITSKTDHDIIVRVVAELTKYYGEPRWSDDKEDHYDWHEPNDLCITARHFRAPEGGWTFYFYKN